MIYKIVLGELMENCYIITEDNKSCVIIDAGEEYEKIDAFLHEKNLSPKAILLTHGHFDHCASCKKFQEKGVKIYIHQADADKLYTNGNLSYIVQKSFDSFTADVLLQEGEIEVNNIVFKVLHTPGHSKGSVVYIYKNNVFCGDLLFENGYGRTDFYDGNFSELISSIKKIKPYLNSNYTILYGH